MGIGPFELVLIVVFGLACAAVPIGLALIVYFLWAKHRRESQQFEQQEANRPEDS